MDFLKDVHGWNNHRPLLWWALQHTKQSAFPILEMGCGDGSTPYLQEYCKNHNKQLISYDYDKEWAAKSGATHVTPMILRTIVVSMISTNSYSAYRY